MISYTLEQAQAIVAFSFVAWLCGIGALAFILGRRFFLGRQ